MEKEIESFYPTSRAEWRAWLQEFHAQKESVWLLYYKKKSGKPSVPYTEAVDEALCFGWIDSKAKPIDEHSYMQFFCRRKANSVWSKINKEKVERLIAQGLMTEAGLKSIETAKANGSWNILDEAEALIIPPDLATAFEMEPAGQEYFLSLSRSDKRNILQWLVLAKRPETRTKRINEIITYTAKKQKPGPYIGKRKGRD